MRDAVTAVALLLTAETGARHALLQQEREVPHVRPQHVLGRCVRGEVLRFDDTEHRAPVVAENDLRLFARVRRHDALADVPQERRLTAFGVAEHQKVWLFGEVQERRSQFGLVEADRNLQTCLRGIEVGGPPAGGVKEVFAGDLCRQHAHCRSGPAVRRSGDGRHRVRHPGCQVGRIRVPVEPRQPDQQMQAVAGHAASGPAFRNECRGLATEVGIRGVTEPQLDARAELILECGPDLAPS
ncbi:hypothetical protein MLGJGCBP_08645 [Rhodococcus sp. T7]|nr:hypothetical protein MLGJGCBP_08645 [Rhodococcus sp. T7]